MFIPKICLFLALISLPASANLKQEAGISFAEDVPEAQVQMLGADFSAVSAMRFAEQDPELLATLDLKEVSGTSLTAWFLDRVQYIVSENFAFEDSVFSGSDTMVYENPGLLPLMEKPGDSVSSSAPKYTLASNIGSSIYVAGKIQNELLQADIPGRELLPVRSPRAGIMKIGAGLFKPLLGRFGWQGQDISTATARLLRLGALFHEARHSDGNGHSLGFFHAVCPPGHDFAGRVVCDRSLNGAYTVGGLVERNFVKQCTDCSVGEKEAFRLYTADSFNRIIRVTRTLGENGAVNVTTSGFLDASPEGKR